MSIWRIPLALARRSCQSTSSTSSSPGLLWRRPRVLALTGPPTNDAALGSRGAFPRNRQGDVLARARRPRITSGFPSQRSRRRCSVRAATTRPLGPSQNGFHKVEVLSIFAPSTLRCCVQPRQGVRQGLSRVYSRVYNLKGETHLLLL